MVQGESIGDHGNALDRRKQCMDRTGDERGEGTASSVDLKILYLSPSWADRSITLVIHSFLEDIVAYGSWVRNAGNLCGAPSTTDVFVLGVNPRGSFHLR